MQKELEPRVLWGQWGLPFQYPTIVKKIEEGSNEPNRKLVYEFLEYMKTNRSSENHQINNLVHAATRAMFEKPTFSLRL
ncbi:MAG: hypothetical protein WBX01_10790 [Nitrososphaeraceae archaeon]